MVLLIEQEVIIVELIKLAVTFKGPAWVKLFARPITSTARIPIIAVGTSSTEPTTEQYGLAHFARLASDWDLKIQTLHTVAYSTTAFTGTIPNSFVYPLAHSKLELAFCNLSLDSHKSHSYIHSPQHNTQVESSGPPQPILL